MKPILLLLSVSTFLFASSCTKSSEDVSQTESLLQHKWTLVSATHIVRDKPTLNRTTPFSAGSYYDFKANDTLVMTIGGAGSSSWDTKIKYTLRSRSVFTLGPGTPVRMITLTDRLLVTQQDLTAIVQGSRGTEIYHGIAIDTLRR